MGVRHCEEGVDHCEERVHHCEEGVRHCEERVHHCEEGVRHCERTCSSSRQSSCSPPAESSSSTSVSGSGGGGGAGGGGGENGGGGGGGDGESDALLPVRCCVVSTRSATSAVGASAPVEVGTSPNLKIDLSRVAIGVRGVGAADAGLRQREVRVCERRTGRAPS